MTQTKHSPIKPGRFIPEITFGRYTGETKQKKDDALNLYRSYHNNEDPLPNELICRDQMQETPPHILFTNYAMLEYLLIRPNDSTLFEGEKWRFIVMDEVHSYSGALGIEISMLLRRLKDRVCRSQKGKLQCIGTSATLGKGKQDYPKISKFAKDLFGEEFEPSDVIGASHQSLDTSVQSWGTGSADLYQTLRKCLFSENEPTLSDIVSQAQQFVPQNTLRSARSDAEKCDDNKIQCQVFLHRLLSGDAQSQMLRKVLQEKRALELSDLKEIQSLTDLVAIGAFARREDAANPLIPARYHIMARAIAGIFAYFDDYGNLQLIGKRADKIHPSPNSERKVFEIASCNRCGEVMLVGEKKLGYLEQPPGVGDNPIAKHLVWLSLKSESELELDEDDKVEEDNRFAAMTEPPSPVKMCKVCGRIDYISTFDNSSCEGHDSEIIELYELQEKPKRSVPRQCPSCLNNHGSVASRMLTGKEVPVAVLTTSLYQKVPKAENLNVDIPGNGRKVMMFSDSRQDAAFFAPFMDNTYNKFKQRRYLVQALEDVSEPLDLEEWASKTKEKAEVSGEWDEDDSPSQKKREANGWVFREWIATDRRLALEGAGAAVFRTRKPRNFIGFASSSVLSRSPWEMSEEKQWRLIQILLDTLRYQGIVSFGESGLDHSDSIFKPRNIACYLRGVSSDAKKKIYSWEPAENHTNKRLDYLRRLAIKKGVEEDDARDVALRALTNIWSCIISPNSPLNGLFECGISYKRESNLFRLKPQRWEVISARNSRIQKCSTCGTVSAFSIENLCPMNRCQGIMQVYYEEDRQKNHYHNLFNKMVPIPLAVREHTAQLTKSEASSIQQAFIQGSINMLSCTTTFEMGVDVGDLQCVIMRNMPPNPGNYVQRAGRAGRRADNAAVIVTYAQRRTHDYAYFNQWHRMVKGAIQPPGINTENEKIIRRHVHAEAMAEFYRQNPGLFKDRLEALFNPDLEENRCSFLMKFLEKHPPVLKDRLDRVLPNDIKNEIGLNNWAWLDGEGLNQESKRECFKDRLERAKYDVYGDWNALRRAEDEAWEGKKPWANSITRQLNTLKRRSLLGKLGTYGLMPKYGFPTEVVELKVRNDTKAAGNVELDRDMKLAISEFAPGNEVIANGYVWTSQGIVLPTGDRNLLEYVYWHCPDCQFFNTEQNVAIKEKVYAAKPCMCGGNKEIPAKYYLHPEFGFTTVQGEVSKVGESRSPLRSYSQVYFHEIGGNEKFINLPGFSSIQYRESGSGWIHVINDNREEEFHVCMHCGYAFNSNPYYQNASTEHNKPWNQNKPCDGIPKKTAIGFRYKTDVLELKMPEQPLENILINNQSELKSLWLSVLYSLVNATCRSLEINERDIDGCLYYYRGSIPSLVLFDTAPGGAGFVYAAKERFADVIMEARKILSSNCCEKDTSCITCLRTYSNQRFHNSLIRGLALDYFDNSQ